MEENFLTHPIKIMLKFESAPNLDNSGLNQSEIGDVELSSEKVLTPEEEKDVNELPEATPESFERSEKDIDSKLTNVRGEIIRLSESVQKTQASLKEVKEGLGLLSTEENSPSVIGSKDRIEQLRVAQKQLELEKEMVIEIKSSMPEDVLKRFDVGEILRHGREKFADHLKNVNLRTLIGYIDALKIDLKKVRELPREWKKKVDGIKQQKDSFIMINPKLSFLSKRGAAELALEELLVRITEA